MKNICLFVIALIILDVCAAVYYFINKDPARGAYWLFAAGISASTIFIK